MTAKVAAEAAHTPAQNTKIEVLAEALETLMLSVAGSVLTKASGEKQSALAKRFGKDAREQLRTALRDFLQPALRLVEGGARQPYEDSVPEDDRIACRACHRHFICGDPLCPEWHASLKAHTEVPPGDNVA
jgi:hypothetical protein